VVTNERERRARRPHGPVALVAVGAVVLAACSSGGAKPHASTATTTTTPATTTTAPTTTTTALAGPVGGPVPTGFVPQSVTFVSPTEGWVLGTAPCPKGPCTSMVRTRDGGATWQGVPAPLVALGSGQQGAPGVANVRFADPLDGWVFGSQLWSTHDGGKTWQQVSLGSNTKAMSIQALEAGAGAAYALDLPGTSSSTSVTAQLYSTPVGTDAWTAVSNTSVPNAEGGTVVVQGHSAWLAVPTAGGSGVPGGAFLARTSSGWVSRKLPCGQFTEVLAAATASDLTAVCASGAGAGQQPKSAYLSSDGGVTWKAAGQAPLGGDTLGAAMASTSTIVISAASGASFLYASFDSGHTWSTAFQDSAGGGTPFRDLGFTTATQGVVIEGLVPPGSSSGLPTPRLLMSRDGGHTWTPVTFRS
jgi:photosystem II stability/assembly factor-like uncharacterized protein